MEMITTSQHGIVAGLSILRPAIKGVLQDLEGANLEAAPGYKIKAESHNSSEYNLLCNTWSY